jgi:competence ComEA-like helix-hairpin-helix protein
MLPADAERLLPYVSIQGEEKQVFNKTPYQKPKITTAILINQATAEELCKLPGFNKSLAARMIKFRDKIGGFQNLDQVRRTYGITDSIFNLISPLIVLQE